MRGTFLVLGDDGHGAEMGLNGHILRQWFGADHCPEGAFGARLALEKLHGSIEEIAPDIYLSLSEKVRADGASDTVLVFDRKGAIHWEWNLRAVLGDEARQWARACGVLMDPTDGGVLVALRDPGAVAKISRRGTLNWILGGDVPETGAEKVLVFGGECKPSGVRDLSFTRAGRLMMFCTDAGAGCVARFGIAGRQVVDVQYLGEGLGVGARRGSVLETPNRNQFLAVSGDDGGCAFHELTLSGKAVFHARAIGGWQAVRSEYLDAETAAKLC